MGRGSDSPSDRRMNTASDTLSLNPRDGLCPRAPQRKLEMHLALHAPNRDFEASVQPSRRPPMRDSNRATVVKASPGGRKPKYPAHSPDCVSDLTRPSAEPTSPGCALNRSGGR